MSETRTERPGFKLGEGEAPLETYRSMSGLAIATLVLGLLSFLALFFTILWVVPLVTLVCGLVALRQIAAHPTQLAGRRLALAGISLGLLFLAWGVTQSTLRRQALVGFAEPYVTGWLQRVIDGRLQEAHQMYLEPGERQPPASDLATFYADHPEAARRLKATFDEMPLRVLVEHGPEGQVRFEKAVDVYRDDGFDYVVLQYVFQYNDQGSPKDLRLRVVMRRMYNEHDHVAVWKFHDLLRSSEG